MAVVPILVAEEDVKIHPINRMLFIRCDCIYNPIVDLVECNILWAHKQLYETPLQRTRGGLFVAPPEAQDRWLVIWNSDTIGAISEIDWVEFNIL